MNIETDETSASKVASPGLVDKTIHAIIDIIRSRNLRPGDVLVGENALAAQLGVSRIVVREANRSLAALGIIEIANGKTPKVSVPGYDVFGLLFDHVVDTRHVTVQQVLDVRRSIEVRTAALAAVRRTDREAQTILDHAAAMRRNAEVPNEVLHHDVALHNAIAEAARNPMFTILVRAFEPVTRSNWPVGWKSRATVAERLKMIGVHEDIAKAIADQDVEGARAAMSAHFDDTIRALVGAGVA